MSLQIRRAEREDATQLFALARQYQTGREAIGRDEFLVALDSILRYREHETNVLFVATGRNLTTSKPLDGPISDGSAKEPSRELVGYSLMTVSRLLHAPGLTAHIQEIVVDEASRGAGVGDALIQANEHYCMGRGVRQLSASTARIGSFFNHRGFEVVGEHYRKVLALG